MTLIIGLLVSPQLVYIFPETRPCAFLDVDALANEERQKQANAALEKAVADDEAAKHARLRKLADQYTPMATSTAMTRRKLGRKPLVKSSASRSFSSSQRKRNEAQQTDGSVSAQCGRVMGRFYNVLLEDGQVDARISSISLRCSSASVSTTSLQKTCKAFSAVPLALSSTLSGCCSYHCLTSSGVGPQPLLAAGCFAHSIRCSSTTA